MSGLPHIERPELALSKPATYEPDWKLPSDWFFDRDIVPKGTFCRQAGFTYRGISEISETEMGWQAILQLQRETGCDLAQCAGLIVASSSLSFLPSEEFMASAPEGQKKQRSL